MMDFILDQALEENKRLKEDLSMLVTPTVPDWLQIALYEQNKFVSELPTRQKNNPNIPLNNRLLS